MSNVLAVIPVLNEEKTIGLVLDTLIRSKLFSQIICVNDGSTDNSLEIIKKYHRIIVINLTKNMGKGYALAEGVSRSDCDLVLFLDADFLNLSQSHLTTLIEPVKNGEADAVIGLTSDSFFSRKIFSRLSGQRVFRRKDLMPFLPRMKESRYGVEVLINKVYKSKKVEKVLLKDLKHLVKTQKRSSLKAVKEYLVEGKEIAVELAKDKKVITS